MSGDFVAIFDSRSGDFALKLSGHTGPKAGEEEELRLVFKISISLLARLEISKLEVFSKICATNLNAYSEKSPRTYPGLAKMCLFRTSDY